VEEEELVMVEEAQHEVVLVEEVTVLPQRMMVLRVQLILVEEVVVVDPGRKLVMVGMAVQVS
jgi:hypothetical protein